MNRQITYYALDLLYSIFVAAVVIWCAQMFLPVGLGPVGRMVLGMIGGMALSWALAIAGSPLLGMFETMYLGCFSGMAAGMLGAMAGPDKTLLYYVLSAILTGAAVWVVHLLLNNIYLRRRYG